MKRAEIDLADIWLDIDDQVVDFNGIHGLLAFI